MGYSSLPVNGWTRMPTRLKGFCRCSPNTIFFFAVREFRAGTGQVYGVLAILTTVLQSNPMFGIGLLSCLGWGYRSVITLCALASEIRFLRDLHTLQYCSFWRPYILWRTQQQEPRKYYGTRWELILILSHTSDLVVLLKVFSCAHTQWKHVRPYCLTKSLLGLEAQPCHQIAVSRCTFLPKAGYSATYVHFDLMLY